MKTKMVDIPDIQRSNWVGVIRELKPGKALEVPLNGRSKHVVDALLRLAATRLNRRVHISRQRPGVLIVWEATKTDSIKVAK